MAGSHIVSSGDCTCGTVFSAKTAANALIGIDGEAQEALANACRTLLVNDVSDIFFAEVAESRKYGVRSSLTETAKRCGLDVVGEFFQSINVRISLRSGSNCS